MPPPAVVSLGGAVRKCHEIGAPAEIEDVADKERQCDDDCNRRSPEHRRGDPVGEAALRRIVAGFLRTGCRCSYHSHYDLRRSARRTPRIRPIAMSSNRNAIENSE